MAATKPSDTFLGLASPDVVLLSTQTASSSSSLDFTAFDNATYYSYMFVWEDFTPGTDSQNLYIRTSTDGGSTFDTSGYGYNHFQVNEAGTVSGAGSASAGHIDTGVGHGTAANECSSGNFILYGPGTASFTHLRGEANVVNQTSNNFCYGFGGVRESAADVDALRLLMASGNIATGTCKMYGMK